MTDSVLNIMSCYLSATDAQYDEGMSWYDNAHRMAYVLANGDVWKGAGVIAAYSINTMWDWNVTLAASTLLNNEAVTNCLSTSANFAARIMAGEHTLDVLRGNKIRAFASAIADPANSNIATIDRHARDIAYGRVVGAKVKIGKREFQELSDAYVCAAQYAGISVAQMQAVTWVVWRERKG